MKLLLQITLSVGFLAAHTALADSSLISSPDQRAIWSASLVDSHEYLGQPACQAFILSKSSLSGKSASLEEVALRSNGVSQEPTVLVRVQRAGDINYDFHRAELRITSGGTIMKFEMIRAEVQNATQQQVVALAKLADRQAILNLLRSGSEAEVILMKNETSMGQVVERLKFALRGSTAATSAIEKSCQLSIGK